MSFCLITIAGIWAVGIATAAVPNPGHSWDDVSCNAGGTCVFNINAVGTEGYSATSGYAYGYNPGVHAGEVRAEGSIGAGKGGGLNFLMDENGNGFFMGNVRVGVVSMVDTESLTVGGCVQTKPMAGSQRPACNNDLKGTLIICEYGCSCASQGLEICNGNSWVCVKNV